MRRVAILLWLAGCAALAPEEPAVPPLADEQALEIPTQLKARTAKMVLSSRWRTEIEVEAISVDRSKGSVWIARGGATLRLRKLRALIQDELKITFLDDHEHLVLYATEVELIERQVGYVHSHRDLQAITIADDKLSLFSR